VGSYLENSLQFMDPDKSDDSCTVRRRLDQICTSGLWDYLQSLNIVLLNASANNDLVMTCFRELPCSISFRTVLLHASTSLLSVDIDQFIAELVKSQW